MDDIKNHKREILQGFRALDATDSTACDRFFEKWGVGQTINTANFPYERLESYKYVLKEIQKVNPEKYKIAHKGTPFFFIGLFMFDCEDFETAIFYISAALSEDRRRSGSIALEDWITTPAGQIMSLNYNTKWKRITSVLVKAVDKFITHFNSASGNTINSDDLVQKFIHPMLQDGHYSVVTAFYSFMLECDQNYKNLLLTTGSIDSTEIILGNLFKGALIFETVAKHYYPSRSGTQVTTLGRLSGTDFMNDFTGVSPSQSASSLEDIVDNIITTDYKNTIETTVRIRNTTGHKLLWDNIFNEPDNYKKMYSHEILAIFYVISKQW